jgi:glycosyltransferase involved in cell wall biosynthesis
VSAPLVSVVTPTWQRHDALLGRCIPSVAAQEYGNVEHVVVSDGPDPVLAEALDGDGRVRYAEVPEHDPAARWGHWARLLGVDMATGDYIAYLDDDNSYRPEHLALVVAALEADPGAGFGYGSMILHCAGGAVIGGDRPAYGQIDTSMLVHRCSLLDVATWTHSLPTIDWDLVERWMQAGVRWAWVPVVTADKY